MHQHKHRSVIVGVLGVVALVAVASCSGDDDSADVSSGAASSTTASSGSSGPASTSGSSTDSTSGGDATQPTSAGVLTAEDPPNPVKGGTLVYGLEADSANPWTPYNTSCATIVLRPIGRHQRLPVRDHG